MCTYNLLFPGWQLSAAGGLPWTFGVTSHLWPQLAHKCVVYLQMAYSLRSKCLLLHHLQARATTGRLEDNDAFISSTHLGLIVAPLLPTSPQMHLKQQNHACVPLLDCSI